MPILLTALQRLKRICCRLTKPCLYLFSPLFLTINFGFAEDESQQPQVTPESQQNPQMQTTEQNKTDSTEPMHTDATQQTQAEETEQKQSHDNDQKPSDDQGIAGDISVGYSQLTDETQPRETIDFSGSLTYLFAEGSSSSAYVSISRLLTPTTLEDDETRVDSIGGSYASKVLQDSFPSTVRHSAALLDLQDYDTDGYQILLRSSFSFQVFTSQSWSVSAKLTPFFLITEFEQTADGEDYEHYGVSESVEISFEVNKKLVLSTSGSLQQSGNKEINYNYGLSQAVGYAWDKNFSLTLSHQISNQVVDPNVNENPEFLLGDEERSLFSASFTYSI